MTTILEHLVERKISVLASDGRLFVGRLRSFDQSTNIVLSDCVERIFSEEAPVEFVQLGLYILRGDNIALIGEVDEDIDSCLDFSSIRAPPIPSVLGYCLQCARVCKESFAICTQMVPLSCFAKRWFLRPRSVFCSPVSASRFNVSRPLDKLVFSFRFFSSLVKFGTSHSLKNTAFINCKVAQISSRPTPVFYTINDALDERPEGNPVLVSWEHNSMVSDVISRRFGWFDSYSSLLNYLQRARDYLEHVSIHEILLPDSRRCLFFDLDGEQKVYSVLHRRWINELTQIVHWFFGLVNLPEDKTKGLKLCSLRPTVIRALYSDKYSSHVIFPYIQFADQKEQEEILPLLLNTIFCLCPRPEFLAGLRISNSSTHQTAFNVTNCHIDKETCDYNASCSSTPYPESLENAVTSGNSFDPLRPSYNSSQFISSFFQKTFSEADGVVPSVSEHDPSLNPSFPFNFRPPSALRFNPLYPDCTDAPVNAEAGECFLPTSSSDLVSPALRLYDLIDRSVYRHTASLRTFYSCKTGKRSFLLHTFFYVESVFNKDRLTGFVGNCNPAYHLNSRENLHRLLALPLMQKVIQSFGFTPSFRRMMLHAGEANQAAIELVAKTNPMWAWQALSMGLHNGYAIGSIESENTLNTLTLSDASKNRSLLVTDTQLCDAEEVRSLAVNLQDAKAPVSDLFVFCLANLHPERCNDWDSWYTVCKVAASCMLYAEDVRTKENILHIFLEWSQGYPDFDVDENIALLVSIIERQLRRKEPVLFDIPLLFDLVDMDNVGVEFLWPVEFLRFDVLKNPNTVQENSAQ